MELFSFLYTEGGGSKNYKYPFGDLWVFHYWWWGGGGAEGLWGHLVKREDRLDPRCTEGKFLELTSGVLSPTCCTRGGRKE